MITNAAVKAVTWSNQYSVGIGRIDLEHQKWIGMLNDLHSAMTEGRGRSVIGTVLDNLAAYTMTHFANEERLMRFHSYPGYERHKAIHEKLVDRVKSLQDEFHSGNVTISIEVLTFLQKWLIEHIIGVDQQYTKHLNAAGVK